MAAEDDRDDDRALAKRARDDGSNVDKLLVFLTECMAATEKQSAQKVTVSPTSGGYRSEPLETWERKSAPELFGTLTHTEALTRQILELMEDDADQQGSATLYEVRVRRYDGSSRYRSFEILPRRRRGDDRELAVPGETATGTGLLAQTMRHNEMLMRQMLEKDKQTSLLQKAYLDGVLQLLHEARTEGADLRAERAAHLRELEEARSQQAEQDLEFARQSAADKRKDIMVGKFAMVLPALAQAIATRMSKGKADAKPGSRAPSALEAILTKFLGSATDDQISAIRALLGPEQNLLLMSIIDAAEQGGSEFLSTMVNDLVMSLSQGDGRQLGALMERLTPDQRMMLVEAMKLAKAGAGASTSTGEGEAGEASGT